MPAAAEAPVRNVLGIGPIRGGVAETPIWKLQRHGVLAPLAHLKREATTVPCGPVALANGRRQPFHLGSRKASERHRRRNLAVLGGLLLGRLRPRLSWQLHHSSALSDGQL